MRIDAYNKAISFITNLLDNYDIKYTRTLNNENNISEISDILNSASGIGITFKEILKSYILLDINLTEVCYNNGINRLDVKYLYKDTYNNNYVLSQVIISSDYKLMPYMVIENKLQRKAPQELFIKSESRNYIYNDTDKTINVDATTIYSSNYHSLFKSYTDILNNKLLLEKYRQGNNISDGDFYDLCGFNNKDVEILYTLDMNKNIVPVYAEFSNDAKLKELGYYPDYISHVKEIIAQINTELENLFTYSQCLINKHIIKEEKKYIKQKKM